MANEEKLIILNAVTTSPTDVLVAVPRTCPECGKTRYLGMSLADYREFSASQDVLAVFGNDSPENRELLISGICSECWDKLFDKGDT